MLKMSPFAAAPVSPVTGPRQVYDSLQDECQPVYDVEDEEEYGE